MLKSLSYVEDNSPSKGPTSEIAGKIKNLSQDQGVRGGKSEREEKAGDRDNSSVVTEKKEKKKISRPE